MTDQLPPMIDLKNPKTAGQMVLDAKQNKLSMPGHLVSNLETWAGILSNHLGGVSVNVLRPGVAMNDNQAIYVEQNGGSIKFVGLNSLKNLANAGVQFPGCNTYRG